MNTQELKKQVEYIIVPATYTKEELVELWNLEKEEKDFDTEVIMAYRAVVEHLRRNGKTEEDKQLQEKYEIALNELKETYRLTLSQ